MEPNYAPDPGDWVCTRCQCPLEQVKVQVGYLGSAFDVSLPRCPSCGLTMIPKSLAEGKWRKWKPCWKTNDPQHREEPLYQRGFSGWRRRIASVPAAWSLPSGGSRTALSASASGWRIWAAVRA
ncbi:MAG: DVU_1557 family redox protein [Bilophila wadsworthia]